MILISSIIRGLLTLSEFSRYQFSTYKDGGRGPYKFDCWGLVRWVGHHHHGWELLESYGFADPADKQQMTALSSTITPSFKSCSVEAGAVAAGYINDELQHVGIVETVDGKLQIFHASQFTGIGFCTLEKFADLAGKEIRYYRYESPHTR